MSETTTLLRNVHILDPEQGSIDGTFDVRTAEGQIAEIDTTIAPLPVDNVIDCAGGFLMPGLIDAHVHVMAAINDHHRLSTMPPYLVAAHAKRELSTVLDRGFTSVRDAGGAEGGLATALETGLFDGPRLFPAGLGLAQSGGQADFRSITEEDTGCTVCRGARGISRVVDGADHIRRAVREEFRSGATQIKMFVSSGNAGRLPIRSSHFSVEEIRAAVDEAAMQGSYVMAHAYGAESILRAVDAGVRTIEHGNLIDEPTARAIAGRAFVVPTLTTYEASLAHREDIGMPTRLVKQVTMVLEEGLRSLEICREAGVSLGFGTDLEGILRQYQTREFVLRSQVETPAQILHSAITVNAQILNRSHELGKVQPGFAADLLVTRRNPLDDINVLAKGGDDLALIMSRGRLHKNEI